MNAMTNLAKEINSKKSRVVVGLDPTREIIPEKYHAKFDHNPKGVLLDYCKEIIDSVFDVAAAVKPNIAFFERYGATDEFFEVCQYAKGMGMIVIADAKRADIGSTSLGYADAFLSKNSPCDFLTINPYFGIDGVEPFIKSCNDNDKGLFVLVKTSNKSSSQIQDLILENGQTVYETVAGLVSGWGQIDESYGYSNVGAVVGATHPRESVKLRSIMPNTFFLVPGYGAQGAGINDIMGNFDNNGCGAIINASRSILNAYKSELYAGQKFYDAARAEAIRMRDEINDAINRRYIL